MPTLRSDLPESDEDDESPPDTVPPLSSLPHATATSARGRNRASTRIQRLRCKASPSVAPGVGCGVVQPGVERGSRYGQNPARTRTKGPDAPGLETALLSTRRSASGAAGGPCSARRH